MRTLHKILQILRQRRRKVAHGDRSSPPQAHSADLVVRKPPLVGLMVKAPLVALIQTAVMMKALDDHSKVVALAEL